MELMDLSCSWDAFHAGANTELERDVRDLKKAFTFYACIAIIFSEVTPATGF